MNLIFLHVIVIPQANRAVQFASWRRVRPAHGGIMVAELSIGSTVTVTVWCNLTPYYNYLLNLNLFCFEK